MQQVSMAKSIKNDMWISSEDKENPDVLPDLPGYHILVRPVSIKKSVFSANDLKPLSWIFLNSI